jgi:very-short-patch-repair endonuclease
MRTAATKQTGRARSLRRNSTDAEGKLWFHLRNRQLGSWKFARQEPIGPYYADFVCRERGLIVEVDGGQHAESLYDEKRDAELAALGYRVVRVWNNEVLSNIEGVLEMLLGELGGERPLTRIAAGDPTSPR